MAVLHHKWKLNLQSTGADFMSHAAPGVPGLVHFVYICNANYEPLLVWNFRNTCEWQNHSFVSNKDVSQALFQTLQTTKINFENCLKKER